MASPETPMQTFQGEMSAHPLFTEMVELHQTADNFQWRETARWIKFEEIVEDGGNRWSKPHVPSLSFQSLLELRSLLVNNAILLDVTASTVSGVVETILDFDSDFLKLDDDTKDKLRYALMSPHRHQHESSSRLPIMGKRGLLHKHFTQVVGSKHSLDIPDNVSTSSTISRSPSGQNFTANDDVQLSKGNKDFMRKIPDGAEACNVLIGEVDFLDKQPLAAFVRLSNPARLGNWTEVPVATRFVFVLVGPQGIGSLNRYREMGRVMATLMCDPIFSEVAYKGEEKEDLLNGLDEFMESVTILPPGAWDPSVRIEPPSELPSQESRKHPEMKNEEEKEDELVEENRIREESGLTRSGRLFGGLVNDIKRKAPWYTSDYKDAFTTQCLASWLFLYFACLTPIVTFGGLLGTATHNSMAAIEALIAGSICGIVYSFCSGQPLTVLGLTGPVLVFESIIAQLCRSYDLNYLEFRVWVGIWVTIFLILLVAFDASAFVCYITRFTEEIFATLIALIFMVEAVKNISEISHEFPINKSEDRYACSCMPNETYLEENEVTWNWTDVKISDCTENPYFGELVGEGCKYYPDVFLLSMLLFLGTFIISVILKEFKTSPFFPTSVRQVLSDFAVIIAIAVMTGLDLFMGLRTPKLTIPEKFHPTLDSRGFFIPPFGENPLWSVFVAPIPALLASILIFMDQQITAVIVNRKDNKLKKGCGYHLDLFVLSFLILLNSLIGIPWFVAATTESLTHVNSLKMESESAAPGEKPQFLGVREQRLTHLGIFVMIGLSVLMAPILSSIPMPVLYGVFLYMGFNSIRGMQFFHRILLVIMPAKYQPDTLFLRKVPLGRIHLFTLIQLVFFIGLWVVKAISVTSILFPLMLVVMILVRKMLNLIFTQRELKYLDEIMPGSEKRKDQKEINLSTIDNSQLQQNKSPSSVIINGVGENGVQMTNGSGNHSSVNVTDEVNKTGIWKRVHSTNKLRRFSFDLS